MATARSNRLVYKIDEITVNRGTAAAPVLEPIVAKLKKSHADFLGLIPLASDDPLWTGTFQGSGANAGKEYLRQLGGFKENPFTLVAKTEFSLTTNTDDPQVTETTMWKTITVGLPKGATMLEFKNWIDTLAIRDQVKAIISPRGRRFPYSAAVS